MSNRYHHYTSEAVKNSGPLDISKRLVGNGKN